MYIVLMSLFSSTLVHVVAGHVTVTCSAGTFLGETGSSVFNNKWLIYRKYLGIPYAEPPVGLLRFSKTISKRKLTETYDATFTRASCLQIDDLLYVKAGNYSEDCLYLNIYVPESTDDVTKYPVMIWIHGGGSVTGSADYYVPDVLSPYGEVVVVTINYRLGVFGYLSTGDDEAPGNFGLWDQHMAIRWVHENIAAFGGDPSKVTLFGESSGAASALYQGLYKGNQGLIHGVVAQSGTPFSFWAYSESPNAEMIADLVGCRTGSSRDTVNCLRAIDAAVLTKSVKGPFGMTMMKDYDFIKFSPTDLISAPQKLNLCHFTSLNLLIGVNRVEGALDMIAVWPNILKINNFEEYVISQVDFEKMVVPTVLRRYFSGKRLPPALFEATIFQYTDWKEVDNASSRRDMIMRLTGDTSFVQPSVQMADARSSLEGAGSIFFYDFAFESPIDMFTHPLPRWIKGPSHGAEMQFVFGLSRRMYELFNLKNPSPSENEVSVAGRLMTMWSNFAKKGNPNQPRNIDVPLLWKEYDAEERNYLEISETLTVKRRFGEPWTTFWRQFAPSLLQCSGGVDNDVPNEALQFQEKLDTKQKTEL